MSWTDERAARLRQLWADGQSPSAIATALGFGATRNAVIGKAFRMGLMGPKVPGRRSLKRRTPGLAVVSMLSDRKASKPVVVCLIDDVIAAVPISTDGLIRVENLTSPMCRWPIGDVREPDFHFCGAHRLQETPYCERHTRKAYQPEFLSRISDRLAS